MEYVGLISDPNTLAHYGVLGMKWGVRRYQPYSYTGTRKGGKTGQEIGEAAKKGLNKIAQVQADRKKAKDYAQRAAKAKATRAAKAEEAARREAAEKKRAQIERQKQKQIEARKTKGYSRREVKSLSDEEIKARIARLQLEKDYKDISQVDTTEAKKFMTKVATDAGQKVATQLVTGVGKLALAAIINNMSQSDAGNTIMGVKSPQQTAQETGKQMIQTVRDDKKKQKQAQQQKKPQPKKS